MSDYEELIPSLGKLSEWCAEMVSARGKEFWRSRLEKLSRQTRENIPACGKMIDWSKAKQVKSTGGEVEGPVPGCPGMKQLEDFKIYFEIAGKTYRVKLDDPFVRNGTQFGFLGDPECKPE